MRLAIAALALLAACETPVASGIPEVLQGRWGLVAADCEPGRADAKGLMTVTGDTLTFYESRAALGEVGERDASSISARFAFTGEGQSWDRWMALGTADGGQTLVRAVSGAGPDEPDLTYRRCPAG